MSADITSHLPPPDAWPELVCDRPELRYPDSVNLATELLDRHVAEGRGGRLAVVMADGRRASYEDVQHQADRIGKALARLGVRPGDRVAMRFLNDITFVACWLAVQKIGAVGVSTMPMLRARELAYIVNDAEVSVFLCANDLMGEVLLARPAFDHAVLVVGAATAGVASAVGADRQLDALVAGETPGLEAVPRGRRDLALIAYTSGSTGTPKGATHSPADVLASADTYARHVLATRPDDVFGGHPTLAFTFGLGGLLVFPFRVGAATALVERFTPDALMRSVGSSGISVLFCAATTYRLLLQDPDLERKYELGSLRACVSAGEPLPAAVYTEWHRRTGIEILDGIGSTEMFHIFISATPGEVRPGATGRTVPGYEARVVDDEMREVARGTPGRLAVRGPTGCRYWRKPDRQREYVRQGWNITGDVYVQDADGYFWYQCRNDDLIICGGYNIAGPEVESVLRSTRRCSKRPSWPALTRCGDSCRRRSSCSSPASTRAPTSSRRCSGT